LWSIAKCVGTVVRPQNLADSRFALELAKGRSQAFKSQLDDHAKKITEWRIHRRTWELSLLKKMYLQANPCLPPNMEYSDIMGAAEYYSRTKSAG